MSIALAEAIQHRRGRLPQRYSEVSEHSLAAESVYSNAQLHLEVFADPLAPYCDRTSVVTKAAAFRAVN